MYEWYVVDTNEVFYVGKGSGRRYKSISGRNKFFQDMYNSHNCDVRIIYDNLDESEAFQLEIDTIKYYRENTNCRLTNQTDGGEGISGWIPDETFRLKQSKIHKNQWQNQEFRQRMMSIRQDINGVYKSDSFRKKISDLVKGKNNPNYKHYWTKQMKKSLRIKQQSNPRYKNEANPNAKKIICIETGEIFDCIKFAMEKYDIKCEGSISAALKNPVRTAAGLHWVNYSDKYLSDSVRKVHLIEMLKSNPHIKPMKCIEDEILYASQSDLARKIGVTTSAIKWQLTHNNKFIYNNKTYVLL